MKNLATLTMTLFLGLFFSLSLLAQPHYDGTPFKKLDISGAYKVVLKNGENYKVVLEGDKDEDLDRVTLKVKNETLYIGMERQDRWRSRESVTIYITTPVLEGVDISGAVNLKSEDTFKSNKFIMEISGAGSVHMNLDVNDLRAEISGAGNVVLKGRATKQRIELSGAGSYKAMELESEDVVAESSGAGSVQVYASKSIKAESSGAGSVRYRGEPERVNISSSGAGSVKKMN
jgi:hypothetical protein